MQFLAKFRKKSVYAVQSHLKFSYQNSIIRKNFPAPFLKYKRLKLKLRVFLAVTKIIPTCSPVIGQFFIP